MHFNFDFISGYIFAIVMMVMLYRIKKDATVKWLANIPIIAFTITAILLSTGIAFCADLPAVPNAAPAISDTSTFLRETAAAILQWLAIPLAALISALVVKALAALANKFHISMSQDLQDTLKGAAKIAVDRVEQWAATQTKAPLADAKLNAALSAMKMVLGNDIAQKFSNETLTHYIEAHMAAANGIASPVVDSVPPIAAVASVTTGT